MEDLQSIIEEFQNGSVENFVAQSTLPETFQLDTMEVEGVGTITFPLKIEDIQKLKNVAKQAPFGQGFNTVLDRRVRDVLQLEPEQLSASEDFKMKIRNMTADLLKQLDIDPDKSEIEAKLYKLLIYSEGGHFDKHRDTEKEEGMFGSMIFQVPVEGGFQGGKLIVEQGDKVMEMDFANKSDKCYYATLFYADCEHELQKVESGYRVAFVFNLIWKEGSFNYPVGVGEAENEMEDVEKSQFMKSSMALDAFVDQWIADIASSYEFRALPLDHVYTKKNLSFKKLKGNDASLARLCVSNKKLFAFLVLQEKHENGAGGYDYDKYRYGKRSCYGYDDYDGEEEDDDEDAESEHTSDAKERSKHVNKIKHAMEDLIDTDYSTELWVNQFDVQMELKVTIDMEGALVGMDEESFYGDPDHEEYEGYQGNYGPTVDYYYHACALIITPRAFFLEKMIKEDPSNVVCFLKSLSTHENDSATAREQMIELLLTVVKNNNSGVFLTQKNDYAWSTPKQCFNFDQFKLSRELFYLCLQLQCPEYIGEIFKGVKVIPSEEGELFVAELLNHIPMEEWKGKVLKEIIPNSLLSKNISHLIGLMKELLKKHDVSDFIDIIDAIVVGLNQAEKSEAKNTAENCMKLFNICKAVFSTEYVEGMLHAIKVIPSKEVMDFILECRNYLKSPRWELVVTQTILPSAFQLSSIADLRNIVAMARSLLVQWPEAEEANQLVIQCIANHLLQPTPSAIVQAPFGSANAKLLAGDWIEDTNLAIELCNLLIESKDVQRLGLLQKLLLLRGNAFTLTAPLAKLLQSPQFLLDVVNHLKASDDAVFTAQLHEWMKKLFSSRMTVLQSAQISAYPYRMPNASIPGYPELTPFFRSDQVSFTLQGRFSGVKHARNFASKISSSSSYSSYPVSEHYSVTATAGGTGQRSWVAIQKTLRYHEQQKKIYTLYLKELNELQTKKKLLKSLAKELQIIPPDSSALTSSSLPSSAVKDTSKIRNNENNSTSVSPNAALLSSVSSTKKIPTIDLTDAQQENEVTYYEL